ncbi:mannose-6-phosphate isomerase class 1 [Grosmannia clavigera kw1407]|uniref:Mannose-6-phosphate isomerase n=1 Tax=Grosmannia clavigera (strain kw1407 / UAMH 11150) TaxID=655863 RepID=F0XRM5_GROCL|nr:mannose-6-phosphate isomerase class 1 [Grosmannia clavigera kw1407]EFW99671.1 mannose-6-phosphate isomerase class 1 [Grosmannia clavigera kw1407]
MAIAITPFEGLCGFRPLGEVTHYLKEVKPFRDLVGEDVAAAFFEAVSGHETDDDPAFVERNKIALKNAFSSLMSASRPALESATASLLASVSADPTGFAGGGVDATSSDIISELIKRLYGEFGVDYGIFNLFFLNYVTLEPGEALFLQADDIHAYISGDIVECMASSDNVVRAGFTPKFKDVPTLTSMLTYNYAPIDQQKMHPVDYPYVALNRAAYSSGSECILYDPPIQEFSVLRTSLKSQGSRVTFEPLAGPTVAICTGGKGRISVGSKVAIFSEGNVFFVGATAEAILEASSLEEDEAFVVFLAFCEMEDHSNGN